MSMAFTSPMFSSALFFFFAFFFFLFFFAPFVYGLVRIIHTRCVLRCGLPTCLQLCVPVYSSDETITKAPALTLIFLFSFFFLRLLCTALYEIFTLTACCGGASTSARGAAPSCTAAVTAVRVRGGLFFSFFFFFFCFVSLSPCMKYSRQSLAAAVLVLVLARLMRVARR